MLLHYLITIFIAILCLCAAGRLIGGLIQSVLSAALLPISCNLLISHLLYHVEQHGRIFFPAERALTSQRLSQDCKQPVMQHSLTMLRYCSLIS